jgi:hypothetical protein
MQSKVLSFQTRVGYLATCLQEHFEASDYDKAILYLTKHADVKNHVDTIVSVACLRDNINDLSTYYEENGHLRPHLSRILGIVGSALYKNPSERSTACKGSSQLKVLAAACGIKPNRLQHAFNQYFTPTAAADRTCTVNEYRVFVLTFINTLQPAPDVDAVARHRVGQGRWETHPIVYRKKTWKRLYDDFLMYSHLRSAQISFSVMYNECKKNCWWVRPEPPLRSVTTRITTSVSKDN